MEHLFTKQDAKAIEKPSLKTDLKNRKLSPLNEFEDFFDTSATVAAWDKIRPVSLGQLAKPFSLFDKVTYFILHGSIVNSFYLEKIPAC